MYNDLCKKWKIEKFQANGKFLTGETLIYLELQCTTCLQVTAPLYKGTEGETLLEFIKFIFEKKCRNCNDKTT